MLTVVGLAFRVTAGTKGRYLDDVAAEADMGQTESPADQPGIAEQLAHLLRMGIGRDVEILGLEPQEEIADAAADQKCLETGLLQPVQDFQGILGNLGPADSVVGTGNDRRAGSRLRVGDVQ